MLLFFSFDPFFAAYLLILAGGLGTTFCLWKMALGDSNPSHRQRIIVDCLQLDVKEIQEREKRLKEKIKENQRELYILKSELKTLQKNNRK